MCILAESKDALDPLISIVLFHQNIAKGIPPTLLTSCICTLYPNIVFTEEFR